MSINIFFVLLFCALQQVQGSNSTKKKSETRLKTWIKNSFIVLAVNYGLNKIDNAESLIPKNLEPSLEPPQGKVGCKYTVPDQHAEVMMNYIACDKDPEFEKYLVDNSENCSKVKTLYEKVKSVGNCALNIPKAIVNGALVKFLGRQLDYKTNMKMLKEYLSTYLKTSFQTDGLKLKEDFEFFGFVRVLELTKLGWPSTSYAFDESTAVRLALATRFLGSEYKEVDVDHAKSMLELTKLMYPDDESMAVREALKSKYKDVDVDQTKRMLETRLRHVRPDYKRMVVQEELDNQYHDVDVEYAKRMLDQEKRMLKLTKILYPENNFFAVKELTKLMYPDDDEGMALNIPKTIANGALAKFRGEELNNETNEEILKEYLSTFLKTKSLQLDDVDVDPSQRVLELTKRMYPDAESMALKIPKAIANGALAKFRGEPLHDKVYEKNQDLKNSWSLYSSSDMKEALKLTHPEAVKEDFNQKGKL